MVKKVYRFHNKGTEYGFSDILRGLATLNCIDGWARGEVRVHYNDSRGNRFYRGWIRYKLGCDGAPESISIVYKNESDVFARGEYPLSDEILGMHEKPKIRRITIKAR